MKHQSYIHLAVNKHTKIVEYVKVTAYHDKAAFQVLDKALIALGHNHFTLSSYPFELKRRLTKPFAGLVGFKSSDDLNTKHFLAEFIEDRHL